MVNLRKCNPTYSGDAQHWNGDDINNLVDILQGNSTDKIAVNGITKGTALQLLRTNSGATGLEWAAPESVIKPHYTYYIYKSGSNYVAISGDGVSPAYNASSAEFATVLSGVLSNISPAGTPTKIQIGAGDFILNAQVAFPATAKGNLCIEGMGPGITNIKIGHGFDSLGTTDAILFGTQPVPGAGNTGTLTANCNIKSLSCTMSTTDAAKFAVDDWVLLNTNTVFSAQASAGAYRGEMKRVSAVNTGTGVVSFDAYTFDDYTTANAAQLLNVNSYMMYNIRIANLTVAKDSGLTTTNPRYMGFFYCMNVQVDNCQFIDPVRNYYGCLTFYACRDSRVTNSYFRMNQALGFNNQYAIAIMCSSTNCLVANCSFQGRFRHCVEFDGYQATRELAGCVRGCVVGNCTANGAEVASYDTHPDNEDISFVNCSALGATPTTGWVGFELRGRRPKLIGCTVNGAYGYGYEILEDAHDAIVVNCTAYNGQSDGLRVFANTLRCRIIGGNFYNNTGRGIYALSGANYLTIMGADCLNNGSDGIGIEDADYVKISNCDCHTNTGYGIKLDCPVLSAANNINVIGNDVSNNTGGTISIHANVKGNSLLRDNPGYNPVGAITNPFTASTGDIRPASAAQANPTSATTYTNRLTPKTVLITGGTITAIVIDGTSTTLSQGVFKLGIGETYSVTFTGSPTSKVYSE